MKIISKFFSSILNNHQFNRIFIKGYLVKLLRKNNAAIVTYNDPKRSQIFIQILNIRKENTLLMGDNEAYQLYMCVQQTKKITGDIAEVGSYLGASSKIICEAKGERNLYLFDTFEGIPDIEDIDKTHFKKGQFNSSYEFVENYLSRYSNVIITKGLFPESGNNILEKSFSFVNLDVDIYESTKKCLEFFYPRMNKGGIILSHDYITVPGVQKAINEFFSEKSEVIIEMSGSQCIIVKN